MPVSVHLSFSSQVFYTHLLYIYIVIYLLILRSAKHASNSRGTQPAEKKSAASSPQGRRRNTGVNAPISLLRHPYCWVSPARWPTPWHLSGKFGLAHLSFLLKSSILIRYIHTVTYLPTFRRRALPQAGFGGTDTAAPPRCAANSLDTACAAPILVCAHLPAHIAGCLQPCSWQCHGTQVGMSFEIVFSPPRLVSF